MAGKAVISLTTGLEDTEKVAEFDRYLSEHPEIEDAAPKLAGSKR